VLATLLATLLKPDLPSLEIPMQRVSQRRRRREIVFV